jgi:Flp pilus assembly protein TadD
VITKFVLPLIFIFLFAVNVGFSADIDVVTNYMNKGNYSDAITKLEKLNPPSIDSGKKNYLQGICFSRLQEYDKAVSKFKLAADLNYEAQDLYYEYGQALFATNELKLAQQAFKKSYLQKFNEGNSLYYIGYIYHLLEDDVSAKEYYLNVAVHKKADPKTIQIALFQVSDLDLKEAKEKEKSKGKKPEDTAIVVFNKIVPMLREAYQKSPSTPLAQEIKQKIDDLLIEYKVDPDLMENGRKVSAKKFNAFLSQKLKYDDNVTLTSAQNTLQQSLMPSLVLETEGYARYDLAWQKRYIFSGEARFDFLQYQDQINPEVYQNDAFSLYMNSKNKYEHLLFSAPASFLFDLELSKTFKDWKIQHQRINYSTGFNLGFGEVFSFFNFGETGIKIKFNNTSGASELISNKTTLISADQTFYLPNQQILIALIQYSKINYYNNTSTNTNNLLLRADYVLLELWPTYSLGAAMAITTTDTLEQKDIRGTEFTLNPSIDISKSLTDKMKLTGSLEYLSNSSKKSDYAYNKKVLSFEFRYFF